MKNTGARQAGLINIDLAGEWDFTYTPSKDCPPHDLSLNHPHGTWDFSYRPPVDPLPPAVPAPDRFKMRMKVPGYWEERRKEMEKQLWWESAKLAPPGVLLEVPQHVRTRELLEQYRPEFYLEGLGWYRKSFTLPPGRGKRTVLLEFGEVITYLHLWVNEKYAGYHIGSRASASFDVTRFCRRRGPNELLIAVGNDRIDTASVPFFAMHCGGIIGPVGLHLAGEGSIRDLFVRTGKDLQTVDWTAEIRVPERDTYALDWHIREPSGGRVVASGKEYPEIVRGDSIEWSTPVSGLEPWSPENPRLYIGEVKLRRGKSVLDRFSRKFGVRKWSTEGQKLKLNGQAVFLRGQCTCGDHPPGYVSNPYGREYYLRYFTVFKKLGFNLVKYLFAQPPQACFEAADEVGMAVQVSADYRPHRMRDGYSRNLAVREIGEMVRSTRNYASLSMYRLTGEMYLDDAFIAFLQDIHDEIKRADPSSLVLAAHGSRGVGEAVNLLDQGIIGEPVLVNVDRIRRLSACSDIMASTWGSHLISYWCPSDETWRTLDNAHHIFYPKRPISTHETGLKTAYANPASRIFKEVVQPDLARAGILDRAPMYYRMSCRLHQVVRKYCLEEVRLCRTLAICEYLGEEGTRGFVEEDLRLRPEDSAGEIRKYNDENVLLLDFPDRKLRNYWEGDPFNGDWTISLYGPRPIDRGTLRWKLKTGTRTLLGGEEAVSRVPNGGVEIITPLAFYWPHLGFPAKLKLSATFSGSGYRIANDWDFWLFPKKRPAQITAFCDRQTHKVLGKRYPDASPAADGTRLRLVSRLDRVDIEHLRDGGDVALLGTAPFPVKPLMYNLAVSQWVTTHQMGTVIHDHPIFKHVPHDNFGDWQFCSLLHQNSACVWFRDPELPFRPILEVISGYEDVRRQASVFEACVGKGRLFVFACRVNLGDPATVTLLDSIMEYVQSPEFKPGVRIDPKILEALVREESSGRIEITRETVRCPYVATAPFGNRGRKKLWLKAKPISSNFGISIDKMTFAEREDNAGKGTGISSRTMSKDAAERAFSATLRVLHDDLHLYLSVRVQSKSFAPPRPVCLMPREHYDYLRVEFPGADYTLVLTEAGPYVTCDAWPGKRLSGKIEFHGVKGRRNIYYEAALPFPQSPGADTAAARKVDLDIMVFHALEYSPAHDVIPFRLSLELEPEDAGTSNAKT